VPADTDTWISVLQVAVSIAGLVITIWLAFIVQRGAARLTELEFARAIRDTWIHVDETTLKDPELLGLASQFLPPHQSTDPGFQRKRLWLLLQLNPLQTTLQAARQGLFGREGKETIASIRSQLAHVVKDDDAYWVTQNQGYDPVFMAICREVRAEVERSAAAETATGREAE
jgi:hypothetical protein